MKCKYCGKELSKEVYKIGKCGPVRMIVFCGNEKCKIQPCTADNIPSVVIEEVKHFSLEA